jgi:hypothetical protein
MAAFRLKGAGHWLALFWATPWLLTFCISANNSCRQAEGRKACLAKVSGEETLLRDARGWMPLILPVLSFGSDAGTCPVIHIPTICLVPVYYRRQFFLPHHSRL